MKTILIAYILFIGCSVFAQEDEKIKPGTPINSGFVFIDGNYIEPPYIIEQKESGKISINGLLVLNHLRLTDTVLNPFKIDSLPAVPSSINKNSSFKDLNNTRYNDKRNLIKAVSSYYFTHYTADEASKYMVEFIKHLPNVASIEKDGKIKLYNGEEQYWDIGPWENDFFEKYGINSKRKLPTKKEIQNRTEPQLIFVMQCLQNNQPIYFSPNILKTIFITEDESELINEDFDAVVLKHNFTISIPSEVKEKIQKIKEDAIEKFKKKGIIKNNTKNSSNKKSSSLLEKTKSSSVAFSPNYNTLYAFCPL